MKWTGRVVTDTAGSAVMRRWPGLGGDEADVEIAAEYLDAAAHEN